MRAMTRWYRCLLLDLRSHGRNRTTHRHTHTVNKYKKYVFILLWIVAFLWSKAQVITLSVHSEFSELLKILFISILCFNFFGFVFSSSVRDWTQDLTHLRQWLYHWVKPSLQRSFKKSIFVYLVYNLYTIFMFCILYILSLYVWACALQEPVEAKRGY